METMKEDTFVMKDLAGAVENGSEGKNEKDEEIDCISEVDVTRPLKYHCLPPKYRNVVGAVQFFLESVSRPTFLEKCRFGESSYYQDPLFEPNQHLQSNGPLSLLRKFEASLQKLNLDDWVQVVFHGTPAQNVESILRDGLDPSLRYRQAYGPGEYFSEYPSLSLKYSTGTPPQHRVKILVCLVVLPDKKSAQHVVIENSDHHIPIGTLSWVVVTKYCDPWLAPTDVQSRMMQVRYNNFCKLLLKNGCNDDEQRNRAKDVILMDLQRRQYAMAAHFYLAFSHLLIGTYAADEILDQLLSHIFTRKIPENSIQLKFPGLLDKCRGSPDEAL